MGNAETVYYIVKFADNGTLYAVNTMGGRHGFNYSDVHRGAATRFASIADAEKWLKHITNYHRRSHFGDRANFTIFKVTETTTTSQPVRREVPLGTEGSKVAVMGCQQYLTPFINTAHPERLSWDIADAALYTDQRAAMAALLNAERDHVRSQGNGLFTAPEFVGVIEETPAPTVTRREEPVPPDIITQDGIKYVRCDKAALYAAEPWA